VGFFSNLFGSTPKPTGGELTPEMREVFDRMFGTEQPSGPLTSKCHLCGQPKPEQGVMCRQCQDHMKLVGNNSIHFCGGCGAGFHVEPNVDIFTFTTDGVSRVFCACCLEHLRNTTTGGTATMPGTPRGYDGEGQIINSMHSGATLKTKKLARLHQALLLTLVQNKAQRTKTSLPDPIFIP
jgi:hypothetical protein